MLTFYEFLYESMSKRQLDHFLANPDGSVTLHHPGADLIYSEDNVKIYHLKTPQACYDFGQGTNFCTNTPHRSDTNAHSYLRDGNLFMIHHDNDRTKHWIENEGPDIQTQGAMRTIDIPRHWREKMENIPHTGFDEQWEKPKHPLVKMSHDEIIHHIKNLPGGRNFHGRVSTAAMDRLGHIQYLHAKGSEHVSRTDNYQIPGTDNDDTHFTREVHAHLLNAGIKLHHFADDPDPTVRAHVASYAEPHTIQHLANDPDPHVRKIMKQRLSGGPLNKPHPQPEIPQGREGRGQFRQFFLPFKRRGGKLE